MKISIIVPSYNQPDFIEYTFKNLAALKEELYKVDVGLEVLLFDSCSIEEVQRIIKKYRKLFDYIEIKKDKGQYEAINKGILKLTGDYWTWLNTDDLININGCIKTINILKKNPDVDYIYGNTLIIDDKGNCIKEYIVNRLTFNSLLNKSSTIVQPGSFFKTGFTKTIGLLKAYDCCFDYEYVLRLLNNNCKTYRINEIVSHFRYYSTSKSGAIELKFVNEQLMISKYYKRSFISNLTYQLYKSKFKVLLKNTLLKSKKKLR
jgi:glycosyltransferase involved in cell wall biosynthesis